MTAACVTPTRAYLCRLSGIISSFRAEAAGQLILANHIPPNSTMKCDNKGVTLTLADLDKPAPTTSNDIIGPLKKLCELNSLQSEWEPGHNGSLGNELCDLLSPLGQSLPLPHPPNIPPGLISYCGEILCHPKPLITPTIDTHNHQNIQFLCWKQLKKAGPPHILQLWTLGIYGHSGFDFPQTFWYKPKGNICTICNTTHNCSVYGHLLQCPSPQVRQVHEKFLSLFASIAIPFKNWLLSHNRTHQEQLIGARGLLPKTFIEEYNPASWEHKQRKERFRTVAKSYSTFCSTFMTWFKQCFCELPPPLEPKVFRQKPGTKSWADFLDPPLAGLFPVGDNNNNASTHQTTTGAACPRLRPSADGGQ